MGESCAPHSTSYSYFQNLLAPLIEEHLLHLPNIPSLDLSEGSESFSWSTNTK